jgi:hypothetical protein
MSDDELLLRRKANFDRFFQDLMPCLVDFMGALGINPPHEVLHHAEQFAPLVSAALCDMAVDTQATGSGLSCE